MHARFARMGPTLTMYFDVVFFSFFFFGGGGVDEERDQIALKEGHHRPTSETPFKWRFIGRPMIAQH